MGMKRVIAVAVFVVAPTAWADEVFLRGGGSIHGEVLQRTATSIVMEVGPGRMTLPLARIDHIVSTTSDLAVYRSRAAALAATDVAGWVALGRWAADRDLLTQSRGAYEHALAVDPQSTAANHALGRVRLAGEWVSPEESYRARGYVSFEGRWVTPEERTASLAERAAEVTTRQRTAEAAARAREAEARADAAEANARRAEAEAATQGAVAGGIPYPYVYGGVYGGGMIYGGGVIYGQGPYSGQYGGSGHRGHGTRGQPTPPVQPPVRPPARDNGSTRDMNEPAGPTSRRNH